MREGRADDAEQLEYRMKSKHRGYLWVVDQSRYLRYEGVSFLQGVVVDVTETVELRNAMRMLVDHTLNDIVLVSWTDRAHARFEVIADGISRECGYAGDALARMLEQRLCAEDSRTGRRMFDEVAGSIEAGADSTFVVEAARLLPFPHLDPLRGTARGGLGQGKMRRRRQGRRGALPYHRCDRAQKTRAGALACPPQALRACCAWPAWTSWEWDPRKESADRDGQRAVAPFVRPNRAAAWGLPGVRRSLQTRRPAAAAFPEGAQGGILRVFRPYRGGGRPRAPGNPRSRSSSTTGRWCGSRRSARRFATARASS